jgi:hypothetical protein
MKQANIHNMRLTRTVSIIAISFLVMWTSLSSSAAGSGFESPRTLKAKNVVPADLLESEHYTIDKSVKNDGYLNYYTVNSNYGDFQAIGTAQLRIRIGEIRALNELDKLSKSEVFLKAAADAGMGQLKAIQSFATHPIATIKGVPAGIGRMFTRYSRQAGDAYKSTVAVTKDLISSEETGEENSSDNKSTTETATDLSEQFLGVSKAQRAWSRKLGTDPYSSNESLNAAIKEVAWAERLGKLGMKLTPIPKIPGANIIEDVSDAVWSKDPYELQDLNRARLTATGADEESIDKFFGNPLLSPTQQTLLTAAIAELANVEGRSGILEQSANTKTEAEVRFLVESVALLAWYHHNREPLTAVVTDAAIPAGITEDGTLAVLFATDHVYWTETVAQAAVRYASMSPPGNDAREIWFLGTVSMRCNKELTTSGWKTHQNLLDTMQKQAEVREDS